MSKVFLCNGLFGRLNSIMQALCQMCSICPQIDRLDQPWQLGERQTAGYLARAALERHVIRASKR